MKHQTLHMIGNAHIDPVWLWQWQEGFQEVLASFRSALDLMSEDPDFRFTASSAVFYTWVERVDPEMFAEIQSRVAEGRWELVGGWWIEPDCNIPNGESFVRQGLYGQRYFKDRFGVTARVGFNVDSFGHNATLPQILKKSGLDAYVFLRPGPHEKGLPRRIFRWAGDDGSEVLAFRIPFEYLSWGRDLERHVRRTAREMRAPVDEFACFYGVGNHGGGPTRENVESVHRLNASPELPRLIFSTLTAFFDVVRAKDWKLPVVHGELQRHASGCYAAHSGIKFWNRRAEHALMRAEKWAAIASRVTGISYPGETFSRAWKSVLFNQFHDIMAGTSLEVAYEDAHNAYGEALTLADHALNDAVQSLAWNIGIEQDADFKPIVVFNPHAWTSRVPVELEVGHLAETAVLTDEAGVPLPFQRVQSHATAGGRVRIVFMAELPPLGYRVYRLLAGDMDTEPEVEATPSMSASESSLESERFRLSFDPETGYLISLYDKEAGIEALAGPAAMPVVIDDPSDTWSHDVFRFDTVVGAFEATRMRVVEHGPVRVVLRVESVYGASRLIQDFMLYQDRDVIDVRVTLDWNETLKMLKLRFPISVHFVKASHAIPYGQIQRAANGDEEPMQAWVDVSGMARVTHAAYGLSVLNDGKSSVDVDLHSIGLTVLRSPVYAHHVPAQLAPDTDYTYIDQGRQTFTYSLLPHQGSWEEAGTVHRAEELNELPVALIGTYRPHGALPLSDAFLEVDCDNVVVTVLKEAEEGEALILRAYETTGAQTHATLRLPRWGAEIEADFGPAEIKTFRIPIATGASRVDAAEIREVGILEWDNETLDIPDVNEDADTS
jgi:alpha-mannosidase